MENILPAMVVTLVMSLLFAASKKKAKEDPEGNLILKLPRLYPIIGLIMIFGGLGLIIFALFYAQGNDIILASTACLIAMLTGLLLYAKGYISNIRVTDQGIVETTIFAKEKEIRWNEIQSISFGAVSLELKIQSSDKKIKAHMHLVGFPEFIAELEEKTGKSKTEMGIPA